MVRVTTEGRYFGCHVLVLPIIRPFAASSPESEAAAKSNLARIQSSGNASVGRRIAIDATSGYRLAESKASALVDNAPRHLANRACSKSAIPSFFSLGLPLVLCWAKTIHSVQGLTLDRVYIGLGDGYRKMQDGMLYVAASRARRLGDIAFSRNPFGDVKCSERTRRFEQWMETTASASHIPFSS